MTFKTPLVTALGAAVGFALPLSAGNHSNNSSKDNSQWQQSDSSQASSQDTQSGNVATVYVLHPNRNQRVQARIQGFRDVTVKDQNGNQEDHVMALVNSNGNRYGILDLGNRDNLANSNLSQGDTIEFTGRPGKLDNKGIVVVERFRVLPRQQAWDNGSNTHWNDSFDNGRNSNQGNNGYRQGSSNNQNQQASNSGYSSYRNEQSNGYRGAYGNNQDWNNNQSSQPAYNSNQSWNGQSAYNNSQEFNGSTAYNNDRRSYGTNDYSQNRQADNGYSSQSNSSNWNNGTAYNKQNGSANDNDFEDRSDSANQDNGYASNSYNSGYSYNGRSPYQHSSNWDKNSGNSYSQQASNTSGNQHINQQPLNPNVDYLLIGGTIEGVRTASLQDQFGNKQEHDLVRIRMKDGRVRVVDLADSSYDRSDLHQGDRVTIVGRQGTIDGRAVVMAERVNIASLQNASNNQQDNNGNLSQNDSDNDSDDSQNNQSNGMASTE